MSLEQNKAAVRRYYELLNQGNLVQLTECVAPGYFYHSPGVPAGLTGFYLVMGMYRQGFSELHNQVNDLIAEGDRVVAYITTSGVHSGLFMGHPPTGKRFSATGVDIFRLADGKLVERWGVFDTLTLFEQLTLYTSAPPPARPASDHKLPS